MGEYTYGLPLPLFFFLRYSDQVINPMKYRMLIKMDSEAFVAASLLWVGLIVFHHKTSDALRLALYQIIDRNWQNYEQGIMSQPQLINFGDFCQFQ